MFEIERRQVLDGCAWHPELDQLGYIEAWGGEDKSDANDYHIKYIRDEDVDDWLSQRGRFAMPPTGHPRRAPKATLRLLMCERVGWYPFGFAMSRSSFLAMEDMFDLPSEMLPIIYGNSGREYWNLRYEDKQNPQQPTSIVLVVKVPQMFQLGNLGLALNHSFRTGSTSAFLHGWCVFSDRCHVTGKPFIPHSIQLVEYIQSSLAYLRHPLLLPTVLLREHNFRIGKLRKELSAKVTRIEKTLGVTQAARLAKTEARINAEMQYVFKNENARLSLTANLNTAATDVGNMITVLKWDQRYARFLSVLDQEIGKFLERVPHQVRMQLARAIDTLEGHVASSTDYSVTMQSRLQLQLDVLYNLIAQAGNELNAKIATTTGLDSSAMKTLAFVTIVFLPPSFVATMFSMSMFDWQGGAEGGSSKIVVSYFWIYWVVTIPLTLAVILGWRLWWRSQKSYYAQAYSLDDKTTEEYSMDLPPPGTSPRRRRR